MGCAASQPVRDDLTLGDAKQIAVSNPGTSLPEQKHNHYSGDSVTSNVVSGQSKHVLQSLYASIASGASDSTANISASSGASDSPANLSASNSEDFGTDSASSCDDGPQQRAPDGQQAQQQQQPKQPQPVRLSPPTIHDSAGSAEARAHRRSRALAQAEAAAAAAAACAGKASPDAASPGPSPTKQSPAAADAMRARHISFQDARYSDAASSSQDAACTSQDDQIVELGACTGHAMSRLSAAFSRRLSRTDERGSADLNRRQSLSYMKEVDSIVQSFDIQDDEIEFEHDEEGNDLVLGHGAFGQVYKGLRGGIQDVAVKVLFDADEGALSRFIKEICLLKSLNYDRNIVQFYGARLKHGAAPMMVLEYMEGGNLRSAIDTDYSGQLKWNMRGFSLALDIAKGIHFLHAHNVIHSDLKTSNILLDRSQTTAKISDVGLARVMQRKEYRSSDEHAWTFVYAAPEMLMGRACTEKSDIYSFGVCLWELVMREAPIRGRTHRPKTPQDCPEVIADLISKCMSKNADLRPTAREVHDTIKKAHSAPLQASSWFA